MRKVLLAVCALLVGSIAMPVIASDTESMTESTSTKSTKGRSGRRAGGSTASSSGVVKEWDGQTPIPIGEGTPVVILFYFPGYNSGFNTTFARFAAKHKECKFYKVNLKKYPEFIEEMGMADAPYVAMYNAEGSFASTEGQIPGQYLEQMYRQVCVPSRY